MQLFSVLDQQTNESSNFQFTDIKSRNFILAERMTTVNYLARLAFRGSQAIVRGYATLWMHRCIERFIFQIRQGRKDTLFIRFGQRISRETPAANIFEGAQNELSWFDFLQRQHYLYMRIQKKRKFFNISYTILQMIRFFLFFVFFQTRILFRLSS